MLKACLLAFVSGIFFFFLILQSVWWLLPGVLTWTAIFVWQDQRERIRANGEGRRKPASEGSTVLRPKLNRGKTTDEVLPKVSRPE
jgi:hypothetical protein